MLLKITRATLHIQSSFDFRGHYLITSFSTMADALVSGILEQLTSIVVGELLDELKLLKRVEKEIPKLKTDFEAIKKVLDDAEKRRLKDDAVQNWLDELKQVCYDMEDVLDDWRTATILKQQPQPPESASWFIKKVTSWTSSYLPWINRTVWKRDIALKIKDINQRLDIVVNEKDRFKFTTGTTANEPERPQTTSFVDVSEIYGRDHVKKSLIDRLLSESSQEEHNLSITAIVGMGGIGKTSLAQLAFNDENVKKHFKKRIWVCVSDPFNVTNIARAIMEGLNCGTSNLTQLQNMLQKISEAIKNQKFLLILDDVWNDDYKKWEPLRNCLKSGAQGSKILVTTRSGRVANVMEDANPISLEKLSTEQCWSIFSKIAFFGRSKEERKLLEEICWKMSERCKGLPLAAKVLGGLMRFKRSREEWQNVLDSDLWEWEEANKELDSVFMLSYYDLPSPMKRCFIYCAILPEDQLFRRDRLIQHWMANGFLKGREMEITGEEYFESLAMRSLFQDFKRYRSGRIWGCKMHDLVREFALRVSRNECGAIEIYKDEEELMKQELPAYAKLRHARLTFKGEHSSSSALTKFRINGLRTLVSRDLEGPNAEVKVLGGLLSGLTSLRALEFISSNIKEVPVEIGKLMHLRYLQLEGNIYLEALPETVCDLFNLQTLKLNYCGYLKTLPRGIGKLLNLRHLELVGNKYLEALPETVCDLVNLQTLKLTNSYSIKTFPRGIGKLLNLRHLMLRATDIMKLPKGIGELTSLRTLSLEFKNGSDNDKEERFGIGDLEKLNCLEVLVLYSLGNVELGDVGEAKRARLNNKKNLRELVLFFAGSSSSDAAVEALDQPPSLEDLWILRYNGTELPSWITCLSGLKFLHLYWCPNLKELPGDFFERLPLLQRVRIDACPAVTQYCRRRMTENSALASVFDIAI